MANALLASFLAAAPAVGFALQDDDLRRLKAMSLEELANIEVSIASNRPQKAFDSPAAVFVITQDDIRRSSATSIPELLRMVPGFHVARIDSNKWSVTARGFSGRFANKLLVLIDGRSVYTPLFSGVFWEVQDTLLEDIERIEIVRGPGAAVWGANAVNGVINIITRNAKDTQGALVAVGTGGEERGFAGVRYGGKSEGAHFRAYAKAFERRPSTFVGGARATDDAEAVRAGFRADWAGAGPDSVTVQGDVYRKNDGQRLSFPSLTRFVEVFDEQVRSAGGNLLARWERLHDDSSTSTLQVYFDRTLHDERSLGEQRNTVDAEYRHALAPLGNHRLVWGLGARVTRNQVRNSFAVTFDPTSRTDRIFSAFAQDEIAFAEGRWNLTVGSKLEHNERTGFEVQPNIRLLWRPTPHQAAWAAVSRAVRTPSLGERDLTFNALVVPTSPNPPTFGLPLVVRHERQPQFGSEVLLAYESGLRLNLSERLHVDIAGFYNDYENLISTESLPGYLETTPLPPHLVASFTRGNRTRGSTRGLEVGVDWRPIDGWRLRAAYSWLNLRLRRDGGSGDLNTSDTLEEVPVRQLYLSSAINLGRNLELDLAARHASELPALAVPSYTVVDARLGWKISPGLELSLHGRNLLGKHYLEYQPTLFPTAVTEASRGVFGKVTWRF